jgi:hypothetical protein
MGLATSILRSRAVAALTSPQGVDRYLEQVDSLNILKARARLTLQHLRQTEQIN